MKFARSLLRLSLALLVGYVGGALLSGPVKVHGRTTVYQSAPSVQRSTEAVYFGTQRFELGMPKSEALARLAECCRLSGSKDSFFVEKKESPFDIIGAVWFVGDKVSELKLDLNQFQDQESAKLGLLLFRTASEITHSEPEPVILETNAQEIRGGTMRTLSLTLKNGRSLVIEANTSDPGGKVGPRDWVDVYELLH
jgi:hypothetical protein